MARRARTSISLVIVALLLLETGPVVPTFTAGRVPSARCEIAATEHTIDLVAVPADRAGSPLESASFERGTLGTFAIVAVAPAALAATALRPGPADARRRTGAAWVRALQQRARSPGDPDPL